MAAECPKMEASGSKSGLEAQTYPGMFNFENSYKLYFPLLSNPKFPKNLRPCYLPKDVAVIAVEYIYITANSPMFSITYTTVANVVYNIVCKYPPLGFIIQ